MDLLRKYMLSTAMLRSPDDPGAAVVDPPATDPIVVDPAAAGDPPAADPPVADPPRNQPPKWALDRISAETAKREAAEQRAADAEALAARLQATRAADPAASSDPAPARPVATTPPANLDALVNAETTRRELNRESSAIRSAGMTEFGAGFSDTLSVLNAVGAVSDDIVLDLVAVDRGNSHKILTQLAKDPEKAAAFAQLDSRRRIAELTRMSDALKTPPAAAAAAAAAPPAARTSVSRAPAPAPAVDPSAVKTVDWRDDKTSDAEFSKGWEENFKKRSARR